MRLFLHGYKIIMFVASCGVCGWAEAVDGQRRRRRKYMRMSKFLFMLQSYKLENSE